MSRHRREAIDGARRALPPGWRVEYEPRGGPHDRLVLIAPWGASRWCIVSKGSKHQPDVVWNVTRQNVQRMVRELTAERGP